MSKTKVKTDFSETRSKVKLATSPQTVRRVADLLDKEVKGLISKGLSPVFGEQRFIGYKDPAKYPGDLKPKRPVNLEVTGDFLKAIGYEVQGSKIIYGLQDGSFLGQFTGIYKGTLAKPARPRKFLPLDDGARFKPSIINVLLAEIKKIIFNR